ncbi:MAG: hypothetical protein ABI295_05525 [Xanthomarina sp.]
MKNLHIITLFILSIITLSCSKNDDNNNNDNSPAQQAAFQAEINGGTFSNYSFTIGYYEITKGTFGNTLSIDISDSNGELVTLFLNGTGGFSSGTVKEMGNNDSNNFRTYVLIRQQQPQLSYYSSSGSVTITNNREHPTESGYRLISGHFNVVASTADGNKTTSMSGTFTDLKYVN